MRVAVVGSSPIMLTAARYLTQAGNSVTVFEERPVLGGAWSAPGLSGLKHRHANLIVAYDNNDMNVLNEWKDFLFDEMKMFFKPLPDSLINMKIDFHSAFDPDFSQAYAAQSELLVNCHLDCVEIGKKHVEFNNETFDLLLLPAFCSLQNFIVNGVPHYFQYDEKKSLHAVCEDRVGILDYTYTEGDIYLFDRYYKNFITGVFVARVKQAVKTMPINEMIDDIENNFNVKEIVEYKSFYRHPALFDKFKGLENLSNGIVRILDTRQFCWGLRDMSTIDKLLKD
jgi:hypothetical protein